MGQIIGIVAADENWGIGKDNRLLYNFPEDMKFFKETTSGQIVAMGYNTLLSLPNSKPLPNRVNLVLAPSYVERDDCIVVHSFIEMICLIAKYTQQDDRDVYVIGGAMFYESMLPYYDKVLVTKIGRKAEADAFFPNLDRIKEFSATVDREVECFPGCKLSFMTYRR